MYVTVYFIFLLAPFLWLCIIRCNILTWPQTLTGPEFGKEFRSGLVTDVIDGVLALTRAFGLVYGAIDIIRSPEGRHVFLEINPAGEFQWIEATVGYPVSGALADIILGRVVVDRPPPALLPSSR